LLRRRLLLLSQRLLLLETISGAFQLADVGADLVAASERKAPVESTVTTDHLSLANPGARLGEEANATHAETAAVDTSHLQLDQPGVRLGVPEPEATDIERLLNFDFELGEVGEVLVESSPQVEPELPDLSHLQLESLPSYRGLTPWRDRLRLPVSSIPCILRLRLDKARQPSWMLVLTPQKTPAETVLCNRQSMSQCVQR